MKKQIDHIDKQILIELRKDARISIQDLARIIDVRRSTIYAHLRKLQEKSQIEGFTVVPNFKKIGLPITAFILISNMHNSEFPNYENVSKELCKNPFVTEVYAITGEFDFLLKVRVESLEHLGKSVLNPIKQIGGISKMQTIAVFHTEEEELSNSLIRFDKV